MGGNIFWLLEAKSFANDPRPEEARALKVWLRPGEYAVGKQKRKCDIVIVGDKSVSSEHARIIVPGQRDSNNRNVEERTEVLRVVDTSKFGTLVTNKGSDVGNLEIQGTIHASMEVYDGMYVKFGHLSVFRVKRLSLSPVYHPVSMNSTAVDMLRLFGIDKWDPGMKNGKDAVLICAEKQQVDGTILLAVLLGASIVSVKWVEEWNSRKVWIGERPKEEDFPVNLYLGKSGKRLDCEDIVLPKTVHHVCSVANARQAKKVFGKYMFVWPWEEKSLVELDFLSVLNMLQVHVEHPDFNEMERNGMENLENYVMILKECENSIDFCKKFRHWCTVESLIAAIMTGHFQIQRDSDVIVEEEKEVGAMDASKDTEKERSNLEWNDIASTQQHLGQIESNADGWVDVMRGASCSVIGDDSIIIVPSCLLKQTSECATVEQSELKSFERDKKHKMSCEESDASFQLPNYKAFRPKEPPVESGVLVPMDETVHVRGNKGYTNWMKEEEKRLELERRKDLLFDRELTQTKRKPRQIRRRN